MPPSPEQLEAVAETVSGDASTQLRWAAHVLRQDSRLGLETAHNLVTDAWTNLMLSFQAVPPEIPLYDQELMAARVTAYGAVGRPATFTPDRRRGW